jgi:hypothetical protein
MRHEEGDGIVQTLGEVEELLREVPDRLMLGPIDINV